MFESLAVRYLIGAQTIALLIAAGAWWRVWRCPCELFLQHAAFWTALVVSKAVVLLGLSVLFLPKQ